MRKTVLGRALDYLIAFGMVFAAPLAVPFSSAELCKLLVRGGSAGLTGGQDQP